VRRLFQIAVAGLSLFVAGMAASISEVPGWKAWFEQNAGGFSGVALIARGDAIEFVHAAGVADRSTGAKITPETRFNLGSINKTFTALAIAQLIQEGRVSLDDRLAKFLPDYPNAEAAAKITIKDLIRHRSGVAQFMGGDFGAGTVAEMAQRVGREPQAFEPGTRQEYSNGGYVLLGRVVEVVSGRNYEDYVAEKIYRPAGMNSTGFYRRTDKSEDFARGYYSADAQGRPMRGGAEVASNPLQPGNPAGGGYSTVADMFRFARALRTGRLLNAKMTEYVLNGTFAGDADAKFGFALREQAVGGRRFLGNGGGAPGVNAEFRFEPAGDATVVVLTNASPAAATRLLGSVLEQLTAAGGAGSRP
jgi:CubicO group peptidase (beta-lactamase class C family)